MTSGVEARAAGEPDQTPRPSRRMEVVAAGTALVVSLTVLLGARAIELRAELGGIDPRWWPQLLGGTGAVLSTALLAQSLLRPPAERDDLQSGTAAGRRRLVLVLVAAVAYVILWPVLSFVPATALALAGITALGGGRGWRALLAFPVLTAVFLQVVFGVLLEVPL